MHNKIMGYGVTNFKDLWRWLKKIGHTYSCLRKWYRSSSNMQNNDELYEIIMQGMK